MTFSACAIVPSYNHYLHIDKVVAAIRGQSVPVIIIDDGSVEPAKSHLASLHNPENGVTVRRFETNAGKGSAVIEGFRLALNAGHTHAVQIDADGQHDLNSLPGLLDWSKSEPDALISGLPVYDETIPISRKLARWLTHLWVWVETLSTHIPDSMCGYRVYPLGPAMKIVEKQTVGHYMDFDTEIMVRMCWQGTPIRMLPVEVTYPDDNTSNFRLVADNWRITKMHTRLVLGMLRRFPTVWKNRPAPPESSKHWARINERGAAWGLKIVFALYTLLGSRLSWYAIQPILVYFFLTGSVQRQASSQYWQRIYKQKNISGSPTRWQLWLHYRSFGKMALDKISAWLGDIKIKDLAIDNMEELDRRASSETGIVVFTSHLGNVEVCRALAEKRGANKITVFAHTKHAMRFNNLLAAYNPASAVDVMEVEDIGPGTLIELRERLDRGDWIVIAGDRIPVTGNKRTISVDFLGSPALFSQGPVIIASLLKSPVYIMNCVRDGEKFRIYFDKLTDQIILPRQNRDVAAGKYIIEYVKALEEKCLQYPDQWYNFFDFWLESNGKK
ncbi:glycosyltransferase family 2 protein [Sneathiella marina]|uniref:Glycosyltransferase family 2 protein n=1 Tax=Sneathiella marina TaxID=2950108 RepID=A0ABY4W912_9PROT|nr:glycosyltransferase family 2 protein [Sneathiella marina]USG62618.1 glycosyltransferase family 2 protein [Sneathiella marina]